MAREACKIIIDNGIRALIDSIERILIDKDVYEGRLPEEPRLKLIQRLADIDLATYKGDIDLMPEGGVAGIMFELQRHGLVTEEVWEVYQKPLMIKSRKSSKDNGKGKKE